MQKEARFPARSRRAGKRASLAAGKTGVKRKRSEDAAVPDGGDGAADLLFGQGQRKADIPLARRPEACARRADHAGIPCGRRRPGSRRHPPAPHPRPPARQSGNFGGGIRRRQPETFRCAVHIKRSPFSCTQPACGKTGFFGGRKNGCETKTLRGCRCPGWRRQRGGSPLRAGSAQSGHTPRPKARSLRPACRSRRPSR